MGQRPRTRLPYPLKAQLTYWIVGFAYRALSAVLSPIFRRQVAVAELARANILVVKPCCLGDVLFATPFVRELRHAFPEARITFGVGPHSRAAIAGNPNVDRLLDTGPVGSGSYRVSDYLALIRQLRPERFDACFVLERSAVLASLPLLAGIPIRVGIDSGGRGFSLNVAVPVRPVRPESELYLDVLRSVGIRPRSRELEYRSTPQASEKIGRLVRDQLPRDRPWVVVHCAGGVNPGMTLARKQWPPEHLAGLVSRIAQRGAVPILVGAANDRPVADAVLAQLATRNARSTSDDQSGTPHRHDGRVIEHVVDLVGQLSLDELAELSRRAAVYVGNDTGPSHLAEAAGARVVMLFGPSDPIVYGPRGRNAVPLTAGLWCSPCFENGRVAPCANVLCMSAISVERVWREVERFLDAEPSLP